ncbi:MAG: TraR/DksA C4-type zinc finger protein [Candidatus Omnitrophica bacterium]|nr:TraR/DksA C4-type zinc finger protein [Candidatus Omnitrophota bacterium]
MKKKFDKKELQEFKKLLLHQKETLLDSLEHSAQDTKTSPKDASGDISSYTFHMADVATDTYDREFAIGMASNERQLLYEIEDALKRIEDGTYGICEECANLISVARLKALPYARLCLSCQEKKER